jgi:hypothetical protein
MENSRSGFLNSLIFTQNIDYMIKVLGFCMENGPVTGDGTKVLTVEEDDKFIQAISNKRDL